MTMIYIAENAGGPRAGSGADTMAAKRAAGMLCVAYDKVCDGGQTSFNAKLGAKPLGTQSEQSSACEEVFASMTLPDSLINLMPALVQIILMPLPLTTGAAIATPSVNPYRNNTASIRRRVSLNDEKAVMGRDFNSL